MRDGLRASLGFVLLSCVTAEAAREPVTSAGGELRELIERQQADRGALGRFYGLDGSATRVARLRRSCADWRATLDGLDFDALDQDGRIDWLLLRSEIEGQELDLAREAKHATEEAPLLPFAPRIVALAEARQRVEPLDEEAAAGELDALTKEVAALRKAFEEKAPDVARSVAKRAADHAEELREAMRRWYDFRSGYGGRDAFIVFVIAGEGNDLPDCAAGAQEIGAFRHAGGDLDGVAGLRQPANDVAADEAGAAEYGDDPVCPAHGGKIKSKSLQVQHS